MFYFSIVQEWKRKWNKVLKIGENKSDFSYQKYSWKLFELVAGKYSLWKGIKRCFKSFMSQQGMWKGGCWRSIFILVKVVAVGLFRIIFILNSFKWIVAQRQIFVFHHFFSVLIYQIVSKDPFGDFRSKPNNQLTILGPSFAPEEISFSREPS